MKQPRSLWPLGITVVSAAFLSGIAACVAIACTHKSDLVNETYYDQEIRYQARIDSLDRTRQLATQASADYDAVSRRIVVHLPAEHAGKTATGDIQLYRPSAAGMDRAIRLDPDPHGVQWLDASGLQNGLWRVRIEWNIEGHDFFFDERIVIGKDSPGGQAGGVATIQR